MRKRIYQIIELSKDNDRLSLLYDWFLLFIIIFSIFPLTVKSPGTAGVWIDSITAVIFIIDYILRLLTADYKLGKKGWSFLIYPFTPMALIDLAAILPTIFGMANGFRLLKILRLPRTLRVFRVFKLLRYSRSFARISMVQSFLCRGIMASSIIRDSGKAGQEVLYLKGNLLKKGHKENCWKRQGLQQRHLRRITRL